MALVPARRIAATTRRASTGRAAHIATRRVRPTVNAVVVLARTRASALARAPGSSARAVSTAAAATAWAARAARCCRTPAGATPTAARGRSRAVCRTVAPVVAATRRAPSAPSAGSAARACAATARARANRRVALHRFSSAGSRRLSAPRRPRITVRPACRSPTSCCARSPRADDALRVGLSAAAVRRGEHVVVSVWAPSVPTTQRLQLSPEQGKARASTGDLIDVERCNDRYRNIQPGLTVGTFIPVEFLFQRASLVRCRSEDQRRLRLGKAVRREQ